MGAHQIKRGIAAVIYRFRHAEALGSLLHVRAGRFHIIDRRIRPGVMAGDAQTADVHRIAALAAGFFRKQFGVRFAQRLIGDHLEIVVDILRVGGLVGDDFDALLARSLEYWLQYLCIIGDDADDIDLARDQVFHRAYLQCRIGASRRDHERLDAELVALFLDTFFHRVEPGDAADFDDYANRNLVGGHGRSGTGEQNRCRQMFEHSIHEASLLIIKRKRPEWHQCAFWDKQTFLQNVARIMEACRKPVKKFMLV